MENLENAGGQYDGAINQYLDANKDNQFNLETTAIAASRVFAIPQNDDALALAKNNPAIAKMWGIFQKSNELQKATIDQIIEVQKASHAFIQIINKREMLQAAAIITVKNQLNTLNIENKEIYETIKKLAGNVLERFTQLERKIEHVEAVASLTQWIQNLKWRKYDEDPHTKRFFRILEDFYINSAKNFTLQNLESLKTALDQSAIRPFDAISIEDFTTTLVDELIEHNFNESMGHSPYNAKYSFDDVNDKISLPFLSSLYLISEEYNHLTKRRYAVDRIRDDVRQAALCYLKKDCGIDVSAKLEYYHLGIELLNGRRLIEFLDSPATTFTKSSARETMSDSPIETDTSEERYKAYMDIVVTFLHDEESPGVIDAEEREMLNMKRSLLKLSEEESNKIEESAIDNYQNKDEAQSKYREEVKKVLGNNPEISPKKRVRLDLSIESLGIGPNLAKTIEAEIIEDINRTHSGKIEDYRKVVREKLEEAHEISPKTRIYLDLKVQELGLDKKLAEKCEKEEMAVLEAKAGDNPILAAKLIRKAAERGDKDAQYNLGECYFEGTGVPEDEAEAVIWFRKAAEQGHAEAQNSLGVCLMDGLGVLRDETQAIEWFHKGAEQGDENAQKNLGFYYYSGKGVVKDNAAAIKWFRKAAEQGNVDAQTWMGIVCVTIDGSPNEEAIKWLHMAAEQGDENAQMHLGQIFFHGDGVDENLTEAAKWYLKAAVLGNAEAQHKMGCFYFLGWGVGQDQGQAAKWFNKAAEQGNADAQFQLGDCYLFGYGVDEDKNRAAKCYREAAEQGNAIAQCTMANASRNESERKKWFNVITERCDIVAPTDYSCGIKWGIMTDKIWIKNCSTENWIGSDLFLEMAITYRATKEVQSHLLFDVRELPIDKTVFFEISSVSGKDKENLVEAKLYRLKDSKFSPPYLSNVGGYWSRNIIESDDPTWHRQYRLRNDSDA